MKQSTVSVAALAASLALVACSSSTDVAGAGVTAPIQTWPALYDLTGIEAPYALGNEYTIPTTCNRTLRSSLTGGVLTLNQDGSANVEIIAWQEMPSSTNAPGIPCPSFFTINYDLKRTGTYTLAGSGASRSISITLQGAMFATGASAGSTLASRLALSAPGYTIFGSGKPFDPLEKSTWTLRQ